MELEKWAICTTTSFYYKDQNSFRFSLSYLKLVVPVSFFYQLFWTQASPEGMCMKGTQVLCEVPSLSNPTTCEGWPHHRGLWPLLFSNSDVDSFTSHKNKSVKVLWDGTYSFSSSSENTRKSNHLKISFITKAALSYQLFKDPERWSGWGLNPWPCALQTGALPTELTRQWFR